MLKTVGLTTGLVNEHRRRRHLLGRLTEARQQMSAPGGQKAQRVVSAAIRELQALMRANRGTLAEFGDPSPLPVDDATMANALHRGGEDGLRVAYHLLDASDLGFRTGRETGLVRQCREVCRGACVKAGLGDPEAR